MSDELRDRIAAVIFHAEVKADEAHADQWERLRDVYEANAQAIIDDLGLTVETARDPFTGGVTEHSRAIGRWGVGKR